MHIAYLIPTIDRIGGAERQLIQLARGMARRHWRVTVIALSGKGGHAAEELSANNVSFLSLEMRKGLADLRGWRRLRRWITSAQPEILHSHLPHASLMARCIRLAAPVRVVVDTIHSPATGPIARQISYRLTSQLPNIVTAVSRAAASPWIDRGIVDRSKLTIIPNGVDADYWKCNQELRIRSRSQSSPNTEFRWLAVGRLDPVKDHTTLLRAFALLPQTARLAIAGSGRLELTLRRLAMDLGLANRVLFLGFQSDVRQWMQQSNAFVLSSRWEGLPVSLMEASACELPSVFTETAGSRELLPDSHFPPAPTGDPAALAIAMQAMMNLSESERRDLGVMARQRMMDHYNLNSVIDRYEMLYCRLLALNPQASRRRRSRPLLPAPARSSTTEI
jgi:glycosyltransferase involved in cell wall biosynthesis